MNAPSPHPAHSLVREGLRHHEANRTTQAAECYRRALELEPGNFDALHFLGVVRFRGGDCDAGIALLEKALAQHPNHASALNNLGNALRAAGRLAEAVTVYRRAVALVRPPRALFLRNLGSAQLETGEWAEAEGNLRCAATLTPDDPIVWCWMGHLERALDRPEAALEAYGKALALDPSLIEAHRGRGCVYRNSDRPVEARAEYARVIAAVPRHVLARLLGADTSLCVAEWESWNEQEAAVTAASPVPADVVDPYSACFMTDDPLVLRRYSDAAAGLAQSAAVGNRVRVLAAHPAPIQASWLGYPGTLGGSLVDYLITDGFTSPPGSEAHYSEQLVRLPHACLPSDPSQPIGPPPPRSAFGLSDSAVVLCSFSQMRKLNPNLFEIWMDVLKAVPEAVLWLRAEHPLATANLRREAQRRAVDPEQLVFAARAASAGDYLARYQVADLVLDTFPYASHSTAADVLWAGCPIVTPAGRSFASRVCGSLLRATGMSELVTESADEYRALAVALARDAAARAELRARLAVARRSFPPFDVAGFTRSLERAYVTMHERAKSALPAEPISIPQVP